jgi:Transcriptional regulators
MDYSKYPFTKLINMIFRCTQSYTNKVLKPYKLSSGTYPFLLALYTKDGINQSQISRELSVDKAMSARAVKQLISLGYILKQEDIRDSRACRLCLTETGKAIVPVVKEKLKEWNMILTKDMSEDERKIVLNLLGKVMENARDDK